MSRITALIASLALVSSVSMAAAGGPVVVNDEPNPIVVTAGNSSSAGLGGLGAAGTAVAVLGGILIIGALSKNSSGSH